VYWEVRIDCLYAPEYSKKHVILHHQDFSTVLSEGIVKNA